MEQDRAGWSRMEQDGTVDPLYFCMGLTLSEFGP